MQTQVLEAIGIMIFCIAFFSFGIIFTLTTYAGVPQCESTAQKVTFGFYPAPVNFYDRSYALDLTQLKSDGNYELVERPYKILYTFGVSMEPAIGEGQVLYCFYNATQEELRVGSIVAYKEGEPSYNIVNDRLIKTGHTTHRIVAIHEENNTIYYETKGDNNIDSDPVWKTKEDIVCVVGIVMY